MRTPRTGLLACLVVLLGIARPVFGFHTVFDYTVTRFQVDGNRFGAFDGTPDFVDEFVDHGNWVTPYGTSEIGGGRMHVESPGTHVPGPDGLVLDLTENVCTRYVTKGSGSFTATAVFDPIVPPEQHFYHFTLYTLGNGSYFNELFGVDIHTVDGVTRVEQHLVVLDLSHGIYQTVQATGQDVDPAEITGPIHFRLAYDDAAGTIASSFSLDGGTTFQAPFASAPIFTLGRTTGEFLLGADPRVTATTTTTTPGVTTTTTTLDWRACPGGQCKTAPGNGLNLRKTGGVAWTWRKGRPFPAGDLGDPRATTSYAMCIRDGSGALIYQSQMYGGPGCGQGTAGPSCWKPVTANGLQYHLPRGPRARVSAGGKTSQASFAGKGYVPPGSSLQLPVTVQLETTDGTCWRSTFDGRAVEANDSHRFKANTR